MGESKELRHGDNTSHLVDLAGYGCGRYLSSFGDVANVPVFSFSGNILDQSIRSAKFSQWGIGPTGRWQSSCNGGNSLVNVYIVARLCWVAFCRVEAWFMIVRTLVS